MSADQYPFTDMPGPSSVLTASQRRLLRGYPSSLILLGIAIDSAAADSTNTPTTELREGLVMGQIAATGLFKQYSPTATDGTQFAVGVLYEQRKMVDQAGTATQRTGQLIIGGYVVGASCIGLDDAARQAMRGRIIFDDNITGLPPDYMGPVVKTADYTVLAADSGKQFSTRGAVGAVNFTLPTTLVKGFRARFIAEADQNLTVTAPAGKLVIFNNLAGTSGAFSTAGNKIGAVCQVIVNDDASKYIFIQDCKHTLTVA